MKSFLFVPILFLKLFQIDMWSLGCLLAECYTGEALFMGKTKEDILIKVNYFFITRLNELMSSIP